MMRVTPSVWVSFGLVSLTVSVIMAGNSLFDLVPDHDRQVFEYRRDLAVSRATSARSETRVTCETRPCRRAFLARLA